MTETQKSVLVVEDDPLVGLDVVQTLRDFGYEPIGPFVSGEEVLKAASTLSPSVVLMDVSLQGTMDGIETAAALPPQIKAPIIFLTANTDEKTLQRAILTRPYGYLIKPFDPHELRSTIELSLQRFEVDRALGSVVDEDALWGASTDPTAPLSERAKVLSQLAVFEGFPAQELEAIAEASSVRQHDAGELLIGESDEMKSGFIPLTGRISITKCAESGKELIVALVGPGDVFGLFYLIPSFVGSSTARTQIPSRVLWIPEPVLKNAFRHHPLAQERLLDAMAARLVHAHEHSSGLAHSRVEDRIVTMLNSLLKEFGKTTGNANEGRIYITRRELADMSGTTPETAIRITKSLERDGVLDLTKPGIIKVPNVKLLQGLKRE